MIHQLAFFPNLVHRLQESLQNYHGSADRLLLYLYVLQGYYRLRQVVDFLLLPLAIALAPIIQNEKEKEKALNNEKETE